MKILANHYINALFNNSESLVALYDPLENKIVKVNAWGLQLLRLTDVSSLMTYLRDNEKHKPFSMEKLHSSMFEKGYYEEEAYFENSGEFFWGILTSNITYINDVTYFLLRLDDIHEHKIKLLATTRNSWQFEALYNYATIGIILTDQAGTIINLNNYIKTLFGYTKDELIGKPVEVLIPGKLRDVHTQYRQAYHSHPTTRIMGAGRDLSGVKKDGSEFPVEISLSPYKINDEVFVIAFIADISIRKKDEEVVRQQKEALELFSRQVNQMNIELEQKVEGRTKMLRETLAALEKSKEELSVALEKEKELGDLKSRFVTMASHEFRTPLSTILTSAYLLQQYNETNEIEKRAKHIYRIKGAVGGMQNILEDFLSLGRLSEGTVHARMERIDATSLKLEMQRIIADMQQLAKPDQVISLAFNIPDDVVIDIRLLLNILINLLSNAIKFSGNATTIKMNADTSATDVIISVQDIGIGIPENDLQHLTERFFRAQNASNIQGTGLGLHIVVQYVSLMNGRLDIQSVLDQGSIFTIFIPCQTEES